MSSPEASGASRSAPCKLAAARSASRRAVVAVVGVCMLSLGACADSSGFKPLYGATGGETYDQKLAKVEIGPVTGRVGQRVRNELVFQRSTGDKAIAPELRLDIVLTESLLTTLVNSAGASSSQVYQLEARYQLVDIKTKKSVLDGRSLGRGSFDRFVSVYSNVRGREDAENRVAKSIAEDIRTRLLAHLSRQS
jgi:LPS-assembly lipoprotein